MKKLASLSLFVCVGLVGCNNNDADKEQSTNLNGNVELEINAPKAQDKVDLSALQKSAASHTISKNNKQFLVNGEKFTLLSEHWGKGAKVLNLGMNEFGKMTGDLVIVVKNDNVLSESLITSQSIDKLAVNTYRISVTKDTNLHDYYQKLIANKDIGNVELGIDYSPMEEVNTH